ncbi:MAG: preprotein translocase subunit SecE [Clostridia bacterium]|nr:preprotein translocase subunit SecE [Clostridia bacterium]
MENKNVAAKGGKKTKKSDKPNFFVRIWRKIKEIFSELKKVTWPTFGTVIKQLGCVLAFVLIMLVLIMVIDLGLQQGLKLVQGGASSAIAFIGEVL